MVSIDLFPWVKTKTQRGQMTYSVICELLNGNGGDMYRHLVVGVVSDIGPHFLKIVLNQNR